MAEPTAAVPPQNLNAEESVLGAMMLSTSTVDAVAEILGPADFYRESHGTIFTAALALRDRGEPVDAITLADELEERGQLTDVGDKKRIHELAALVPATANAPHYARIVKEMAVLRNMIRAGSEICRLAWDRVGTADEMVGRAQEIVFGLSDTRQASSTVPIADALPAAFERMRTAQEAGGDVTALPTGYAELDRLTSGLRPGNLVVVAARPSMGKTALALGVGAHAAVHLGRPTVLYTLEMTTAEVTERLLSMEALVESQAIRTGSLGRDEWNRLHEAGARLERAPLLIDDSAAVTAAQLRAKARRTKLAHPDLALVIVDYVQLMSDPTVADNRVQEVSKITRALKVLAGELAVPVVALSQLSRAVEQRHDKRPILSDLRESGSVEQDADLVLLIYRDEYYNPETAAEDGTEGVAEVNLAKNRNGPTGTRKLAFVKRHARFGDLALPGTGGFTA